MAGFRFRDSEKEKSGSAGKRFRFELKNREEIFDIEKSVNLGNCEVA